MSAPSHACTPSPADFLCLRTHQAEGGPGLGISSRLERLAPGALSAGEVLIRSRYAGVNYKDCLALHGRAKIIESYPRIAGIEVVGEVLHSEDPAFTPGQPVMVHGFRTGIAFDGGFAELVRAPAAHVMPLPAGLSQEQAAVLGVPGFTVALALQRFEKEGLAPASGTVAVSGASGAVGMLAIAILSRAGWKVAALTRKVAQQADALRALGAVEIVDAAEAAGTRALEKPRFAAAIDNVGGATLSWLLRSTQEGGCVACVGNAGGNAFEGSVLPFIMRRISLAGIVANASWPVRHELWSRLGGGWKPDFALLAPHVQFIALEQLMDHGLRQLDGATSGRTVVRFG